MRARAYSLMRVLEENKEAVRMLEQAQHPVPFREARPRTNTPIPPHYFAVPGPRSDRPIPLKIP